MHGSATIRARWTQVGRLLSLAFLCLTYGAVLAQVQPVDFVDEYIGTSNGGQTFLSTGPPFAMTQWTPQTREGNVKCIAPYYVADVRIQGFRGSHFLSGSCTQDYGSITIMPESGELRVGAAERSSSFDRTTERPTPYRYSVTLTDYSIDADVAGTIRAAMMRFRFAKGAKSWILVECNSSKGEGTVSIDTKRNEITVVNPVRRLYAGNGKPAGFSGYFVVQFDHKLHLGGTWSADQTTAGVDTLQNKRGGAPGGYVSFDLQPGEIVLAKIGSSFTSLNEARLNLKSEIPRWDFNRVVDEAKVQWNQALNRVQITASWAQSRIFYTALYHSMQAPRVYSDVDGSYPEFAGGERTEKAKDFTYYCDFSLWDTFRALHPLLTILDPDRERDMVKSLIAQGEEGGFLPIYPAWNSYTSEMIGDHAVTIIADAHFKGIGGFDINEAYRLMRKNATELPATHELYADGRGRRSLDSYLKYGYIPLEDPVPNAAHPNEQVSRTLEYAYDDSVVGAVANALGKTEDSALFQKRSQYYKNVIDPSTGFARGRHADGSWDAPFDPAKEYRYITEGLPFQYTFFVPQDVGGLINLVGGREMFIRKLDALFAGGFYDHGNEPSHHIAYLYDNAGAAWKTQEHVRSVMDKLYSDSPGGLAGNDDAGQMSAWFAMSALGFYSVTPGTPVYQIGTPLFDEATIRLATGKQFHIRAVGASTGKQYIRSVTLNGVPLKRYWIKHSEIVGGGELVFEMSAEPNLDWPGTALPQPRD
jgi:predicted alpha-1,2-mannosidase